MPCLPKQWLYGCLLAPVLVLPMTVFSQSVPDAIEVMQRMQFSIREVVVEGNSLVSAADLSAVTSTLSKRTIVPAFIRSNNSIRKSTGDKSMIAGYRVSL
jgi:hypothetical protein